MARILLGHLLLMLFMVRPGYGQHGHFQSNEPRDSQRCLTDELHQQLKQTYPEGVPGRPSPATLKFGSTATDFTYVIPIVVHIMHDNGPEKNVDSLQVLSQIRVLNEDYGRYGFGLNTHADGANCNIRFCLASTDPNGNPHKGFHYVHYPGAANINPFTADTLMKKVVQWDPNRYLNIWTVRQIYNGQLEGYAYFPHEVAGTIWDGLVIKHSSFGRYQGTATSWGRTGTHEVGHYLGLLHPWGLNEGDCITNDGCEDTPPVSNVYFAHRPFCTAPTACNGKPRMIENYMDYSDDECLNIFTNCQAGKMRNSILLYRPQLVSSASVTRTGCESEANALPPTEMLYVYPNPAVNNVFVNVDIDNPGPAEIEIYDFAGRLVLRNKEAGLGRGPIPIDITTMGAGNYHLIVRTSTKFLRRTIVVGRFLED